MSRFALITHMCMCTLVIIAASIKVLLYNCKSSSYHHNSSIRLLFHICLAEAL